MSLLEICVDELAGLDAAVQGGADRIELCGSLHLGGVTPSAGLMAEAARQPIPVIALIRPRSGAFVYSAAEERVMLLDIERAAELGLAGVAIGALSQEGRLDLAMLRRLALRAQGLGLALTLHRAFDLVRDQLTALEEAVELGFHRILTSGAAPKAHLGAAQLAALVRRSRGRIRILAGSGITAETVEALLSSTAVHEIHASGRALAAEASSELLAFGFADAAARTSSAALVRQLKMRILAHQQSASS